MGVRHATGSSPGRGASGTWQAAACTLDNNAAERAIRRPVITRKNADGSRTDDAARLAARIWTVAGTAEMAGAERPHISHRLPGRQRTQRRQAASRAGTRALLPLEPHASRPGRLEPAAPPRLNTLACQTPLRRCPGRRSRREASCPEPHKTSEYLRLVQQVARKVASIDKSGSGVRLVHADC